MPTKRPFNRVVNDFGERETEINRSRHKSQNTAKAAANNTLAKVSVQNNPSTLMRRRTLVQE